MQKMTGFQQEGLLLHHLIQDRPIPGQLVYHSHQNEYEILLIQKGKGKFFVENREYTIKDKTIFIFKPHEMHMADIEFPCMYDRYTLLFSKSSIDADNVPMSLLMAALTNRPIGEYNCYTEEDVNYDLILACFQNMMEPDFSILKLTTIAHLYPVLYELRKGYIKHYPKYSKTEIYPKLFSQALAYVNLHYAENITLETLAKEVYISKSTMHRMFIKYANTTFYKYLTRIRMLAARKLVQETDLSFTDICQQCGFTDYSAFYRMYKNFFLTSPQLDRKGYQLIEN